MMRWLEKSLRVSSSVFSALLVLVGLFVGAVGLRFVIEFSVNSVRDVSHWVEYEYVYPASVSFPIGTDPVFLSKSEWHYPVLAEWPDVMWCVASEGPEKGIQVRYNLEFETGGELRKAGLSGFYDDDGNLLEASSPGYWTWSGSLPRFASVCELEPKPIIYPSPLVSRSVPVDITSEFRFE